MDGGGRQRTRRDRCPGRCARPPPRGPPSLPRGAPRDVGRAPRPRAGGRGATRRSTPPSSSPAFFHDAVYDPHAADNEEQSARLAERVLAELGWDEARGRRVGDLVRATAAHEAPPDDDTAVLLDADLAVLGSDPAAYQAYVTGVRAEYAHVDAAGWRVGRAPGAARPPRPRPALRHSPGPPALGPPRRRQHDRRARHPLIPHPSVGGMGVWRSGNRTADTRLERQRGPGRRRGRRTRSGIGCGVGPRREATATAAMAARALTMATSTACSVRVFGRTAKVFPSALGEPSESSSERTTWLGERASPRASERPGWVSERVLERANDLAG